MCPLTVLKEECEEHGRMTKVKNGPRYDGRRTAWLVLVLEAQSGLYTETPWDIWVVHKLILFLSKVAIDGQSTIYFVYKGYTIFCRHR